jgi:hypothetical protein
VNKKAPRKGATGPASAHRLPGVGDVSLGERDWLAANAEVQRTAAAVESGLMDQATAQTKVAEILKTKRRFDQWRQGKED